METKDVFYLGQIRMNLIEENSMEIKQSAKTLSFTRLLHEFWLG